MLYIIENLKLVEVDIRYQGYCLISFYLGDMDPQSAGSIYRAENDMHISSQQHVNAAGTTDATEICSLAMEAASSESWTQKSTVHVSQKGLQVVQYMKNTGCYAKRG